jgi:hypothetical protein
MVAKHESFGLKFFSPENPHRVKDHVNYKIFIPVIKSPDYSIGRPGAHGGSS